MKKIFNTINKFMIEISEDNINAHAAASAFYMFLSLVPFVALLTAIIPYTGLSQETLFNAIERYMPDALQAIIESVVTTYTLRRARFFRCRYCLRYGFQAAHFLR